MLIFVIIVKYDMISCFFQGVQISRKFAQQLRAPIALPAPRQTLRHLAVQGVTVSVARVPAQIAQQPPVTFVQLAGAILVACRVLWTQRCLRPSIRLSDYAEGHYRDKIIHICQVQAYCCPGGSSDKLPCPARPVIPSLTATPPPAWCNWWNWRTNTKVRKCSVWV
jgi:hypothetical protein